MLPALVEASVQRRQPLVLMLDELHLVTERRYVYHRKELLEWVLTR